MKSEKQKKAFLKSLMEYINGRKDASLVVTESDGKSISVQFSSVQFSFISAPPHNKNATII